MIVMRMCENSVATNIEVTLASERATDPCNANDTTAHHNEMGAASIEPVEQRNVQKA